MRLSIGVVLFAVLPQCLSAADSTFVWNGEARFRGELDGRDFRNSTPANVYTLLRMRLGGDFLPDPNVHLFIQIQDARVLGGDDGGGSAVAPAGRSTLDLHQGYLRLDELFTEGLSMQVGRMEFSFGNERLVGADDWSTAGRSFDGALFRYRWADQSLSVFGSILSGAVTAPPVVSPLTVGPAPRKGSYFSGAYYSRDVWTELLVDGFLFYEWDQNQLVPGHADLSRFTAGVSASGSRSEWFYGAEGAYQGGTRSVTSIAAFLAAAHAGLTFGEASPSSVALAYEYLSGTPLDVTNDRTFEPMFPSSHRFYGLMDYFTDVSASTFGRGLQDFFIEARTVALNDLTLSIAAHRFFTAEVWSRERDLGSELDLVAALGYSRHADFLFGASAFVPGVIMRGWFGGSDVSWWASLTARVRL